MSKRRFYLALVIFALTGQVAWVVENMYFNVFIYKMFNASASDISLMVQASAVAATLTTIFIGALIIFCNLIADLLCALIDPRIKLTE